MFSTKQNISQYSVEIQLQIFSNSNREILRKCLPAQIIPQHIHASQPGNEIALPVGSNTT